VSVFIRLGVSVFIRLGARGLGGDRFNLADNRRKRGAGNRDCPVLGRLWQQASASAQAAAPLLVADSKKPGNLSAAGLAEQIKMVAGTRYHLYRTVLLWDLGRPRRTSK